MDEIPLLVESLSIFMLSIAMILFCHQLKLPSVVGFLLTGILCGPHGLGIVHKVEDVQTFADIGIILLLFTVGMEVSVKQIVSLRRFFLLGGMLQIGITLFVAWLICLATGRHSGEGILWGCLLALSSTAIVLRMVAARGEIDSPYGHAILAILIFQDFCAVPMMLLIPFLGQGTFSLEWTFFLTALKGIAIIVCTFAAAWLLVPKLLYYIARTRIRELFLLAIVFICLGVAWTSAQAGLSLALGAFLAGLIISQSNFSYEAIGNILPFQDLFTSFFFVSIGMLLDIDFTWHNPIPIILLTLAVLFIKTVATTAAALIVGMPLRSAALVALGLAQISEFSFVLAKEGAYYELMPTYEYQLFLTVALLSMAVTPWIIGNIHSLASLIDRLPLPMRYKRGLRAPIAMPKQELTDHVIIIGFGLAGQTLARSCKASSIAYTIVEMNAETVRREQQKGEPIHYGDASHTAVLEHVKIDNAKVVALVINDATAAMRIIRQIKHLNPTTYLLVRTRYVRDIPRLHALGADDVIPDEYGSAVEVLTRVLRTYTISNEKIQALKDNSDILSIVPS